LKTGISEEQYKKAAEIIGCEVAVIKAVDEVESKGSGFLPDGQVKILFEPHIFWKRLQAQGIDPTKHQKGNEDILYPKWVPGKYGSVSSQWNRMDRAIKINRVAALESASYGRYQVLGCNYTYCGFKSAQELLNYLHINEGNHLDVFVRFIKSMKLDDDLRNKQWESFSKGYNGSGYKLNKYDEKLIKAYNKFK
jgi:hypothetical protein